ncbi:hypothetical protein [Actinomadura sp. CNU-125]|uniref:hypothetical protein n=1 Tax=Actinomadura sp. CNU-125 TaxID=1904961 RepID=UPI0021CCDBFA|nr:hypothetical protein [Actinomadura sp. CNU-125]
MNEICRYRRPRESRDRTLPNQYSGDGTDPVGTNASHSTRTVIATRTAHAEPRTTNHSAAVTFRAGSIPANSAAATGLATACPAAPATTVRNSENRMFSSRRAP